MSATQDNGDNITNVTAQVDEEFLEEFDRALKTAQIEGEIPMTMSRAEALRGLMRAAIDDPSLFTAEDENS